ncbi:translation initiation factor IF-2, chloroplastic [Senna tora]|uniref:Translation initiation factor IF-2, chloroplastic n=1 Tax=Senna tora TaxID=362788 RepID=A0A834WXR1_9FABA|nr:translation initiation factor IF-2, chloroplastic [Senna tora]
MSAPTGRLLGPPSLLSAGSAGEDGGTRSRLSLSLPAGTTVVRTRGRGGGEQRQWRKVKASSNPVATACLNHTRGKKQRTGYIGRAKETQRPKSPREPKTLCKEATVSYQPLARGELFEKMTKAAPDFWTPFTSPQRLSTSRGGKKFPSVLQAKELEPSLGGLKDRHSTLDIQRLARPEYLRHVLAAHGPIQVTTLPNGSDRRHHDELRSFRERTNEVPFQRDVGREPKHGTRLARPEQIHVLAAHGDRRLLPKDKSPKVVPKPFTVEFRNRRQDADADADADQSIKSQQQYTSKTQNKDATKFQSLKPSLIGIFGDFKVGDDKAGFAEKLESSKLNGNRKSKTMKSVWRKGDTVATVQKDEIPDEDASELNVSIPGAASGRKGRKWSKARRRAARLQAAKEAAPVKVEILEVSDKGMLIEELAYNLAISEGEILGYLYSKGIKPDGVQTLDKDMVKMICKEYNVEIIGADPVKVEELAKKREILDENDLDKLKDRPPVITIMGHVDHGKTTLLDYIRKSKVAASEAGGITQGIGAYKVQVPIDGKPLPCVFLDTPGHEAFGAMRARGASVTDIAVIVVAADDGIRPQTNEAIAHAKAAAVPIIVAINKACQLDMSALIDKDGANPERVMQELSSIGLMPEDWGGDVPIVQISALKGENIDDLLETIMLVAELQELKANPDGSAKGTVIEAGLDKSKGPFATFMVQNGTLRRGDIVVCGEAFGKVRALFDDAGKRVEVATPSIPVQVIGLNNVSIAGDDFEVVHSLDAAREKAESRAESLRNERISAKAGDGKVTLSSLASAVSSGKLSGLDLHQLNIILKVDLQGSIEAVRQALQVLPQDNVTLKFLLEATGDVSSSDVDLAVASKAIVLGFNVRTPGSVKSYAENKGVEIRLYRVIYELIDDVRNAMEGLLEPVEEQVTIGSVEVRATFSSGSGRVAGCMVTEGKVVKGCGIRVIHKGKIVYVGILDSLKRVKETVKEVNAGLECGIGVEDFDDWEEGDILEPFDTLQKKRTLEEASESMAAAVEGVGVEL